MINILYFASVRERLECSAEQIQLDDAIANIDDLQAHLAARGGIWSDIFEAESAALLSSVNQEVVRHDHRLKDNDEVAFFPQVTGG